MKGHKYLKDCGSILKKNAKGEEYTWGLRFFKLLTECFKAWSIMDEKGDIAKSYDELRAGGVPMVDQVIYYEVDASQLPVQHQALEKLISEEDNKGNSTPVGINKADENRFDNDSNGLKLANTYGEMQARPQPNYQNYDNILGELDQDPIEDKDKLNPIVEEFQQMKQGYLRALFADNPDANRIMEAQICFQSFFDAQKEELNRILFGETGGKMDDKKTDQLLKDIEFGTSLCEIIDREGSKYKDKSEISRMQKKVHELLKLVYNQPFPEYQVIIDHFNYAHKQDTKANQKQIDNQPQRDNKKSLRENEQHILKRNEEDANNRLEVKRHKSKGREKEKRNQFRNNNVAEDYRYDGLYDEDNDYDYDKDLNIEEGNEVIIKADDHKRYQEENQQLQRRKDALKREVEELKKKERRLKAMSEKTESIRGDADPKLLIEEIHKKNREYETLRSKYVSLMHQMNDKVHMDNANTRGENEYLQKSIMESMHMIENYRNKSRKEIDSKTFKMPTTESYYMPKNLYKSNYNSKYL